MRAEAEGASPARALVQRAWAPVAHVHRTDAELTLTVELPGVAAGGVCVTAEHDVLTVHDARDRPDGGGFVYRFPLPPGVDPTSIRADHADGTLAVHVPNPARFRRTVIAVGEAARMA